MGVAYSKGQFGRFDQGMDMISPVRRVMTKTGMVGNAQDQLRYQPLAGRCQVVDGASAVLQLQRAHALGSGVGQNLTGDRCAQRAQVFGYRVGQCTPVEASTGLSLVSSQRVMAIPSKKNAKAMVFSRP